MQKDFDTWNNNKKQIHSEKSNKLYHAREIWWCALGVNIGFEQDGDEAYYRRPVLILKGFSAKTCLIIPLTSSLNKHPMRVPIGIVAGKEASGVISQMRVIDTKRLLEKVCFLGNEKFELIRKSVKECL